MPFVSWEQWRQIDAHERAAGESVGKPRVKLCSVADMYAAAGVEQKSARARAAQ